MVTINYLTSINPVIFVIGFIILPSLTACQAEKTPLETTQLFWSALAENELDLAKKQCSSQSKQLPSSANTRLKSLMLEYGEIVINGNQASVETQIISPTDIKSSFTTFLVNENESWKIDCQRSTAEFNGNQVYKDFFNGLNDLGERLNKQLEDQVPLFEKEIESFGQALKQQLDAFEQKLKEAFQKKQQDPYQDTI